MKFFYNKITISYVHVPVLLEAGVTIDSGTEKLKTWIRIRQAYFPKVFPKNPADAEINAINKNTAFGFQNQNCRRLSTKVPFTIFAGNSTEEVAVKTFFKSKILTSAGPVAACHAANHAKISTIFHSDTKR